MKILEYDEIDPLGAFNVSLLALDFAFTPERAAHIRRTDPRPFPCLAVYAVEGDLVLGQVGVFRLPVMTAEGPEDIGGVWAVSTHPQYAGRGVASLLLEEAHARMRAAGLRFSSLGTNRWRVSHKLYRRHGYEDVQVWGSALARWEIAHQPTRLRARPLQPKGLDFVEQIFQGAAPDYLGFSRWSLPFAPLWDKVNPADVWVIWKHDLPVGFAFVQLHQNVIKISHLLLPPELDAAEAVAAVISNLKASYVQVTFTRPSDMLSLQQLGYQVAYPSWNAFMVAPIVPGVTAADARCLLGIGTDNFLISWLDTT
jgi:GNAT superfamily N-acetyltransferase